MSSKLKYLELLLKCKTIFKKAGFSVFKKVYWKPQKDIINIVIPDISNPIFLRPKTSDIDVFSQIFLREEYKLSQKIASRNIEYILDCGANIGLGSLYFSRIFPQANLYAIELEKSNFDMLVKNTVGNNKIHAIHGGVWSENKFLEISNSDESKWEFQAQPSTATNTNLIQGITIPAIMEKYNIPKIDILKIDIEGAEYEIFANNADLFLSKTRILIVETHDWLKEDSSKAVFSALQKYSYRMFCSGENFVCEILHDK